MRRAKRRRWRSHIRQEPDSDPEAVATDPEADQGPRSGSDRAADRFAAARFCARARVGTHGYAATMSDSTPRNEPLANPSEAETLRSVLERNRRTFAWKTSGLDAAGLRATTSASAMTLGGLVKHMALVE